MKKIISLLMCAVMVLSLVACGGVTAAKGWQKQYDLGIKYFNDQDYKAAKEAFKKILKIDPYHIQANGGLLKIALENDDESAAQTHVETIKTGYTNVAQVMNQAEEELQQAIEKYEEEKAEATEDKPAVIDRTVADSEDFKIKLEQFQAVQDPEAMESFEDVKETLRDEIIAKNPQKEITDDDLHIKYLENKNLWWFTEEDIKFAVEVAGWEESGLRYDIAVK